MSPFEVKANKGYIFMAKTKLRQTWDYPPMPYLEQVLNHAPKAGSTYLWLWKHMDDNHICQVRSSRIADVTMMSKATFKHDLRALCRLGLVNIEEHDDITEIELTAWHEEDESYWQQ